MSAGPEEDILSTWSKTLSRTETGVLKDHVSPTDFVENQREAFARSIARKKSRKRKRKRKERVDEEPGVDKWRERLLGEVGLRDVQMNDMLTSPNRGTEDDNFEAGSSNTINNSQVKEPLENTSVFISRDDKSVLQTFGTAAVTELMGLLCLDGNIQHTSSSAGDLSVVSMEKFTTDQILETLLTEFKNLSVAAPDGPTDLTQSSNTVTNLDGNKIINMMINPLKCNWENEESVMCWCLACARQTFKIVQFFDTPCDLNRFFHRIWRRGCPNYSILLRAGMIRNWSVHMMLTMMHGFVIKDLFAYIMNTVVQPKFNDIPNVCYSASLLNQLGHPDIIKFKSKYNLFTNDVFFDKILFCTHLVFMGVTPRINQPVYKMDITDLIILLVSIGKAWITHDFWFRNTMRVGKLTDQENEIDGELNGMLSGYSEVTNISIYDAPFCNPIVTGDDPGPTTSKCFVEQISCIFTTINTLLYWIRNRVVEIFSHDSMDLNVAKSKELLLTIDLLSGFYTTLIAVFDALYTPDESFYNLELFMKKCYLPQKNMTQTDDPVSPPSQKHNFLPDLSKVVPPQELGRRLARHAQRLAREGDSTDHILSEIDEVLTPIHTEPYYYGRCAGEESNVKSAKKWVLPGSVTANFTDILIMTDGNVDIIQQKLGETYTWGLAEVLQVEAIDAIIQQYVTNLTLSENMLLREIEITESVQFTNGWELNSKQPPLDAKIGSVCINSTEIKKPTVRFRNEEQGFRGPVILKIGRLYLTTFNNHSFASPNVSEAFIAWCFLMDVFSGWKLNFYTSYLSNEKKTETVIRTRDIGPYVTRIIFGDFDKKAEEHELNKTV